VAIDVGGRKRSFDMELDELIGLRPVKEELRRIEAMLWLNRHRRREDMGALHLQSFHFSFSGNPGTGKTTVARMIGEIFRRYGIIRVGDVVEADRAKLIAPTPGETENKARKLMRSALDGVLFVDEAYSLVGTGDSSDPGWRALEVILKGMEDYRDALIVVFAGYPKEMDMLFSSITGLKSRVPYHLTFPDYTPRELVEIALFMASRENLDISDEAASLLMRHMEGRIGAPDFSNAREVRNIIDHAKTAMSSRLRGRRKVIGWDMKVVTSVDMEEALGKGQDVAVRIEEARRAMYSDPSDPIMRLRLADAYAGAGLWSDAVTTLEPMQENLGPEGAAMLGRALYITGEYKKAKPVLGSAGEIADTRFFYGLSLMWSGEFARAAETLESALVEAPDAPERRLALSAARVLANQWEKAAKSFIEALEVSEGKLPASAVRELPLETLPGEGASECLKQAMTLAWLDPARAMLRFAEALEKTGDENASTAAEGMLKNVLKREPDNAGAHRMMASMAAARGRYEQAVMSLEIALDLEPRRTEDWMLLADLYRKTGNEEKAREIFVEVLEDSGSGKVALELALVAEKEERVSDAAGLYEKAWAAGLKGDDAMLCARRLGSMRASAGRFAEALRIFESAPGSETEAAVAFWKARCCVESGKWAEAEPLLMGATPEGELAEAFMYWRLRLLIASRDLFRARGNLSGRAFSTYLALAEAAVRAFSGEPSARSALDGVSTAEMGCDALSLYALARAATRDWSGARLMAGRASASPMGPMLWERQTRRPAEESHYLEAVCQAHLGDWVSALELFRKASGALQHPAALFGQGLALVALSEAESAAGVLQKLGSHSEAAAGKLETLIQSNSGIRKILADPVDPGLLDPFVFQ